MDRISLFGRTTTKRGNVFKELSYRWFEIHHFEQQRSYTSLINLSVYFIFIERLARVVSIYYLEGFWFKFRSKHRLH